MYGGTRWCVWHKTQIGWFIISPQKSHSDNANFTWILKQKDLLSRRTFSSTKHSCNESALISWQTTPPHILPWLLSSLMDPKNIPISTDPSIFNAKLPWSEPIVGSRPWPPASSPPVTGAKGHPPPLVAVKQLIEPPPLLWSFPGHRVDETSTSMVSCMVLSPKKNEKTAKRIAVGEDRISLLIGAQLLFWCPARTFFVELLQFPAWALSLCNMGRSASQ